MRADAKTEAAILSVLNDNLDAYEKIDLEDA